MFLTVLPVLIMFVWVIMGVGVFNLWKIVTGEDKIFFIILLWPLVLIITAIIPREQ